MVERVSAPDHKLTASFVRRAPVVATLLSPPRLSKPAVNLCPVTSTLDDSCKHYVIDKITNQHHKQHIRQGIYMKKLSILIIPLLSGTLYGAQLTEVEMSKGVSWVGYFDEDSRIISVIKPKSVVVLPSNIEPAKIDKIKDETPQMLLLRGECLRRYGEALKKEADTAKHIERKKLFIEKGQSAIDEAELIIKNANELLALIKLTKDQNSIDEKENNSGLTQEWAKAIESLNKISKDRLETEKKLQGLAQEQNTQRIIMRRMVNDWFLKKADLNEVKITINAGEIGSAQKVQEIESLNNWLKQVVVLKDQGKTDGRNEMNMYSGQIRSYARIKKQEWLIDVLNSIEENNRN